MRPLFYLIVSFFVTCFSFAQQKQQPDNFIRPLPKPARAVNDFGNFLTAAEQQNLEKELSAYWKATTNAIAIITLDSLTDPQTKKRRTIEETALRYFNTWGLGDKTKNNGVLILLSKHDRQVRIEVGKGLEQVLSNEICAQIIAQQIVPHFKKQAFYTGLREAIQALKKELGRDKQTSAVPSYFFNTRKLPAADKQGILWFIPLIVILFIIWSLVKKNRNNNRATGGMITPGYQDQENLQDNINDQHIINNGIMVSGIMDMTNTSPAANDAGSGSFDSGSNNSIDSGTSSFDGGASSGSGASGDW